MWVTLLLIRTGVRNLFGVNKIWEKHYKSVKNPVVTSVGIHLHLSGSYGSYIYRRARPLLGETICICNVIIEKYQWDDEVE